KTALIATHTYSKYKEKFFPEAPLDMAFYFDGFPLNVVCRRATEKNRRKFGRMGGIAQVFIDRNYPFMYNSCRAIAPSGERAPENSRLRHIGRRPSGALS